MTIMPIAKTHPKLHIGCGTVTPEAWINMDGSWNARLTNHRLARRIATLLKLLPKHACTIGWNGKVLSHDLRRPLPFKDNSLDAIYGSHVLEHLYLNQAEKLLKECFRTLVPGGVVRLVVPDLRSMVLAYLNRENSEQTMGKTYKTPGDELNHKLLLRVSCVPEENIFYKLYRTLTNFHSHKWMYDVESLSWHISNAGFVEVAQKELWVSSIPDITAIEKEESFEDDNGICVEATKPEWIGQSE
jgi:predicted SAM-dependent methyltransferase